MTDVPATVVWDPRFLDYDFGPAHPFTERSRALAVGLMESVIGTGDSERVRWVRAVSPAERSELLGFHAPEYLDRVERSSASGRPAYLDAGDTPTFPGCYQAAARLAAGALRALETTLETHRPVFHPGGGLHHAHPDRASGFCVFNDVALAVARAVQDHLRVAYLDIDAHHGDGVMYGFYNSGRVLDIDFHQDGRTLFPGTGFPREAGAGDGAGVKVNLPLPPATGDEALMPLFRRIVPPMLRSFRPDVIVLQHGVDGHAGDPLTALRYSARAYEEIDRTVLSLARELTHGRLLVTGGGGYRPESVSRVLARTGLLLSGAVPPPAAAPLPASWRSDFTASFGAAAPTRWADAELRVRSPWGPEDEVRLLRELEASLGTSFPESGP